MLDMIGKYLILREDVLYRMYFF